MLGDHRPQNRTHFYFCFPLFQGVFATACLPVLFTLCAMLASAWINAAPAAEAGTTVSDTDEACFSSPPRSDEPYGQDWEGRQLDGMVEDTATDAGGEGGCYAGDTDAACGRLRLEELAFAALCRAARALWGLVLRVLRPEVGDGPAAAVSVISLCSVASFAVPTFRALEDAERTYQVGGCASGRTGEGGREKERRARGTKADR